MHEDILVLLKNYNKKYNQLDDAFQELQHQYDRTQYELRCLKKVLLEVCSLVAPHKEDMVQEMLNKHDKVYRTLHGENGAPPLATIRFNHQLSPELGSGYMWNTHF
ncbi:ORF39 similar to XcGV ORF34 [Cydia pomonella granulovirus]|uniref:ORF39 n=2 Tax=Cydia pomonella granulosis virus TaxID=28289 RepID=A0A097P116_GVCP|nr:ORF39 similar to XcGV ORF34 [Cydia pomonella granulovirus]AAK70699.1 ORF39 similar to XcGV ORF34 [Cydia pomonella granulovirus]AIU36827.1 ORF39 [Cydia pomonella granulovirus]AIU36964.1 ORF39 [Cydia pomonella granulovirus]AIU37106.1 ORF39 [Cydia pomonella granulovirus]QGY99366.1 ORF39 [Cydia pomonella granulovirus]